MTPACDTCGCDDDTLRRIARDHGDTVTCRECFGFTREADETDWTDWPAVARELEDNSDGR